ncbi:MAG: hypothetical protein AABX95_04315, partial [Nanoarchaeota archaeon]
MESKPYIGITGPATVDEVTVVGNLFREAGYSNQSIHVPMIGILVSHKTLERQPTKNRRYPNYQLVPELLREASQFGIPMIHYNSRENDTLADQLGIILADSKDFCQGIQLNIVWPDLKKMKAVKRFFPSVKFVVQLSHSAMNNSTPSEIARRVREYEETANYTLIDPSGGKGREFDIEHSIAVYEALRNQVPQTTIGFAGGFTGANVEQRVLTLKQRL